MSKVVFVGNVPYNMGEEQLIDVFKSVGQVIGFRLVFDRDTGKPKGYGFCEFSDHETAASACRNLNNIDVGGRALRIDLADSDPFLEGKTTVRGELLDGGTPGPAEPRSQWRTGTSTAARVVPESEAFLSGVPQGIQVPLGSTALDTISQSLASMQPSQLMEVLAQMKAFVITHPEQARILLVKHPQLAYALFQALLLNKIVDSAILQRMLAATSSGAAAAAPPAPVMQPPPHLQYPPPPQHMPPFPPTGIVQPQPMQGVPAAPMHSSAMFVPPPHPGMPSIPTYYRPPPSTQPPTVAPSAQTPTPVQQPSQSSLPEISDSQRAMLMQVLSLTSEQINALPEAERSAIVQLRTQFMGGLTA